MYTTFEVDNCQNVFPYQHFMSEIIPNVIEFKSELIGPSHHEVIGKELEDTVMKFLNLREAEILIACDWNLNLPTGYDVLSTLLKMSNN